MDTICEPIWVLPSAEGRGRKSVTTRNPQLALPGREGTTTYFTIKIVLHLYSILGRGVGRT